MNREIKFHGPSHTINKRQDAPAYMLSVIRNTKKYPNRDKPSVAGQTIVRPISVIEDFSKYNVSLNICMLGYGCNKEATWKYYSSGDNILACDEHKRGPMHKISGIKCYHYCRHKPIYYYKKDPTKTPKYCEFHMSCLMAGCNKKTTLYFEGLDANKPLSLDEYEVLF